MFEDLRSLLVVVRNRQGSRQGGRARIRHLVRCPRTSETEQPGEAPGGSGIAQVIQSRGPHNRIRILDNQLSEFAHPRSNVLGLEVFEPGQANGRLLIPSHFLFPILPQIQSCGRHRPALPQNIAGEPHTRNLVDAVTVAIDKGGKGLGRQPGLFGTNHLEQTGITADLGPRPCGPERHHRDLWFHGRPHGFNQRRRGLREHRFGLLCKGPTGCSPDPRVGVGQRPCDHHEIVLRQRCTPQTRNSSGADHRLGIGCEAAKSRPRLGSLTPGQ